MANGYERFFNNPLVMLGANMMQASDPRMEGLGGLGAGISATGEAMRERAQLAEENERARMLADLQMREYQSELDQQQAEQNAREQFAAQAGLTPAQRAAIRAGYGGQVAKAQFAEPDVSGAMKIYRDAGGREGTGKSFYDFYREDFKLPGGAEAPPYKIPANFMLKDPSDYSKGVVRIPGGPGKTQEAASKEAMIDVSKSLIPDVYNLVFEGGDPQGDVRRGVLFQKTATQYGFPGMLAPEGSKLAQNMEVGIQAITRLETGAAMPPGEVANTRRRFEPSPLDADDVIRIKLRAYELFHDNAKRYLSPTEDGYTVDVELAIADATKEMEGNAGADTGWKVIEVSE